MTATLDSDFKVYPLNAEGAGIARLEAGLARLMPEAVGERVGPYKLLEQIGEGGFGTVWVAEQERPIQRRVALKIIKLGMDTKDVVARFEQERQALALMDHPNIARVLDAGATPLGRPFFVMELVRGIKITDYCNQAHLPTIERLKLFIQVCNAVQHAHQSDLQNLSGRGETTGEGCSFTAPCGSPPMQRRGKAILHCELPPTSKSRSSNRSEEACSDRSVGSLWLG